MIEKIEQRRAQLTASHQELVAQINQTEQNLRKLLNNRQQVIGAISMLDNLHPPQADPAAEAPSENGQIEPEPELEEATA
jgi:hypothetical protein